MPGLATPKKGKTIKQHRVCSTPAFIWSLHCLRFCFGSASIVGSMMALQFQPRFIVMLDHVAPCVMFWHFQGSMNWNMIAIAAIVCNCDSFKIHSRACSKSAQDTEDSGCQWLQKMWMTSLGIPWNMAVIGIARSRLGRFHMIWCGAHVKSVRNSKRLVSQSASPNKKGLKRGQEQD